MQNALLHPVTILTISISRQSLPVTVLCKGVVLAFLFLDEFGWWLVDGDVAVDKGF